MSIPRSVRLLMASMALAVGLDTSGLEIGAKVQHQLAAQISKQQKNLYAPNQVPQAAALRQDMGTPQIVQLGVGPIVIGSAIAVTVPKTQTYDSIVLECSASGTMLSKSALAAQIGKVEVVIDADHIWELSGTELQALIQFNEGTLQDNTGLVPLNFSRIDMRLPANEDLLALGTANVDTFQVLVTLLAGATIDTITAYAQVRPQSPLGRYVTYRRGITPFGSTGVCPFKDIAQGPGWNAGAIHFIGTGGGSLSVSIIQVYAFKGYFLNQTKNYNDAQLRRYGKTPQAGWVHIDFNSRGRANDPFPLQCDDFEPRLTFTSNPTSVTALLERWEQRAA